MKEQQIWIKTMDSAAEVGNLILALFEEDEDYSGEMRVLVGKPESGGYEKLSHIYDLSSMAVNVMKACICRAITIHGNEDDKLNNDLLSNL